MFGQVNSQDDTHKTRVMTVRARSAARTVLGGKPICDRVWLADSIDKDHELELVPLISTSCWGDSAVGALLFDGQFWVLKGISLYLNHPGNIALSH